MLSRFRDPYRETRPEPVSNDLKSPPVKNCDSRGSAGKADSTVGMYNRGQSSTGQDPAHVEDFGEMIRDPSKVEGALREAHSHLLRHPRALSGRLTLVTLPNFEPILSNQALHQFILDDHLATNCCIVLLTPESARLQAHQAFDLVQKVDPKGHRTIGLLSCADAAEAAQSSSTANISRAVQSGFRAFRSGSGGKAHYLHPRSQTIRFRGREASSHSSSDGSMESDEWQGPLFSEAVLEGAYDDPELGNEFSYAYAACAAEINDLATSTIIGDELGGEIEAIYELLGYRAFVDVPMFVPLPRKEDDHPAFKQLSELADTSLYPPAHQTTEPQMTDIRSRRPKVYLTEVQAHMKRKSSGNSHPFSEKTP
ncbi:hypothetical protein KEM48_014270 [Puccinia striiformis f. sp. tritici PST-130]|nr:hypothetical protein KEM48_014270 [Puccinia striiformis f. sp. tritici PST-130]